MIASLRGTLLSKEDDYIVIDVGGVGYRVFVSINTLLAAGDVGDELSVFIHTQVREDAFLLYGFSSADERAVFRALLTVKDIGPKLARSILAMTPQALAHAIGTEDRAALLQIKGVGKRTAERLLVELKDALAAYAFSSPEAIPRPAAQEGPFDEVAQALFALGYKRLEVDNVLRKLEETAVPGASVETLIQQALQAGR